MADFPSYVHILAADYGEQPDPSVERTEMERGPAYQTGINSRVMVEISITMLFNSKADMAAFFDWWRNDIKRSQYFTMAHPMTQQPIRARFVGGAIGRLEPRNPMFTRGTRQASIEYMA